MSPSGNCQGDLSAVAQAADNAPVVLVIPASQCVLRQIPYEAHERKLLHKIVPFTLEEEIIDRVEDTHFAISPSSGKTGDQQVAAVCYLEKNYLKELLQSCRNHSLDVVACIPEIRLVPWETGQWTVVMPGNGECLVRYGENAGLACSPDNLSYCLKTLARDKPLPDKLLILCPSEDEAPVLNNDFPGVDVEIKPQDYLGLLSDYAEQDIRDVALLSGINLLSGEFAPALPWKSWWQQWKVAAMLVAAIGVADLGYRYLEINRLATEIREVRTETEALFRQVYPEGVIADPRLQLERKLASLQGNSDSGFIALLSQASQVIMDNPEIDVRNIDYSETDRRIQLTFVTTDFNAAESIRARLEGLGLEAELTGSSTSEEGSRSRLLIGNGAGS